MTDVELKYTDILINNESAMLKKASTYVCQMKRLLCSDVIFHIHVCRMILTKPRKQLRSFFATRLAVGSTRAPTGRGLPRGECSF